jgi:hypothetical protein
MRFCLTIIFYFYSSAITYADSPLTSIKFWDLSNDSFILKTGKISGKKKLSQSVFDYLMNDQNAIIDRYALINALGWEFKSEIRNSDLFLEFVHERFKKEITTFYQTISGISELYSNKKILVKSFIETNLDCEYSLFYDYLFALDNYIKLDSKDFILLDDSEGYLTDVPSSFIKTIIEAHINFLNMNFESISKNYVQVNTVDFGSSTLYNKINSRVVEYIDMYNRTKYTYCQ